MILPNPRRLHPFQITDSVFTLRGDRIVETWWAIGRRGEQEDMEAVHGPFVTPAMARAFAEEGNA